METAAIGTTIFVRMRHLFHKVTMAQASNV